MTPEEEFRASVEKAITEADATKFNRVELLVDIFKSYVAKMFEFTLGKKEEGRMELNALIAIKRNLISEFRQLDIGETQRSVEWYEDLFDATVKEIFNDASLAHKGEDQVSIQQKLQINKSAYVNEGGLYVPSHMSNN